MKPARQTSGPATGLSGTSRSRTRPSRTSLPRIKLVNRWDWYAAGAMAVLVVAIFHTFVFSDAMLFGTDMVPMGYMMRQVVADYWRATLSVPVWNPYILCGLPVVDAMHGDIFYPAALLYLFMPLAQGAGLEDSPARVAGRRGYVRAAQGAAAHPAGGLLRRDRLYGRALLPLAHIRRPRRQDVRDRPVPAVRRRPGAGAAASAATSARSSSGRCWGCCS